LPLGIFDEMKESMDSTNIAPNRRKNEVFQRGKTVMPRFLWGDGEL